MKLLKSKLGIPIPKLFFISNKLEIKDIPKGVPYFLGNENTEEYIITILEYEVLYQKGVSTGLPFDFGKILRDGGYRGIDHQPDKHVATNLGLKRGENIESNMLTQRKREFVSLIKDNNYYVDINVIKDLNIIPTWMNVLEEAISTNVYNFGLYDTNMYNKKLEGMYGGFKSCSPKKNLIIIDISGSIPRLVSKTCLVLARNMAESFYADIMITGSKSTLYEYEDLDKLDVETIYEENGMDNDRTYFKKLLTETEKEYDTLIVFGDEDSPNGCWYNPFNKGHTSRFNDTKGQALNKWKVNNIISFHADRYYMNDGETIAAYGRWFKTENVKHIKDWVKYLR